MGFMITTFDDKEAEWYERTQNIISALNAGVDSLVLKKGEVEQKKEEWEEILRREEEENAVCLRKYQERYDPCGRA